MSKKIILKRIGIFALIVFFLLKAISFKIHLDGREVYFYSDDGRYAVMAQHFLAGDYMGVIHPWWQPGFPLATIPFFLLSGRWEMAQILLSMFSFFLLAVILYHFFKKFSYGLAILFTLLYVFSPGLTYLIKFQGITEPLFLLLLWPAILLGWLALSKNKWRYYILSGALFGLAYLTRTEAIAFVGIYLLLCLWTMLKKKIPLLGRMGIFLIVFFVVISPYVFGISGQLGKFALSGKNAGFGSPPRYQILEGPTTWGQDIWSLDYPDYHSPYYNIQSSKSYFGKSLIDGTFLNFARKEVVNSFSELFLSDHFLVLPGLVLAVFGLVFGLSWKKYRPLTLFFFIFWLGGTLFISIFMKGLFRYLGFSLPFFIYLQALALYFMITKTRFIYALMVLVVLIFITQSCLGKNGMLYIFQPERTLLNEDKKIVGDWIKSQGIKIVGARMDSIGYYGGAKVVYTPASIPEEIVQYMKDWGVEYLVAQPQHKGYDYMEPIYEVDYVNKDLTLIKKFDDGSLVWKISLNNEQKENNMRIRREMQLQDIRN